MKFAIGGINIDLESIPKSLKIKPEKKFLPFLNSGKPDVCIAFHLGSFPELKSKKKIFVASDIWGLYQVGDRNLIECYIEGNKSNPYQIALFSNDFKRGDVYIKNQKSNSVFLGYPLDELLMVNLLCRKRGMMVHGCGIVENGNGLLFLGQSGAGKSTIANLYKKQNVVVLSDDRIIVRYLDGKFYIFGTPWHGNADVSNPGRAPLKSIFFIEHGNVNRINKLGEGDLVSRLVSTSFVPFWNKKGMEYTLSFCARIGSEIPVYVLKFLPDEKIIGFIENINENSVD